MHGENLKLTKKNMSDISLCLGYLLSNTSEHKNLPSSHHNRVSAINFLLSSVFKILTRHFFLSNLQLLNKNASFLCVAVS